jgi:hypothetical protein
LAVGGNRADADADRIAAAPEQPRPRVPGCGHGVVDHLGTTPPRQPSKLEANHVHHGRHGAEEPLVGGCQCCPGQD